MEADKGKILQTANQLAAKGQFDKAIAEWKKLLADSPNDGSIHNNIGDLHLKRNATGEAIEAYLQAGLAFHATGSALKAIAVYKKILKLDPSRYSVYQQLGDLNAERGLVNNAIADYLTLSKLYLRDGRTKEALAVYRRIVDLDPTNLSARQRLAELCLQENQRDEAIKAYLQLGKEAVAQQQVDQAKKAYEAVLKLDPNNAKAAKLLQDPSAALKETAPSPDQTGLGAGPLEQAQHEMEAGRYEDAERLLSDLLSAQPGDPEVCRLLAMLHLKRGELAIAMSEIQFLSEAAIRAEDYALAESMIGEYLKIDPGCVGLLELLAALYEHKGDAPAAALQYGHAAKALLSSQDADAALRRAELCEKIKALDPNSSALAEFATTRVEGIPPVMDAHEDVATVVSPVAVEPASDHAAQTLRVLELSEDAAGPSSDAPAETTALRLAQSTLTEISPTPAQSEPTDVLAATRSGAEPVPCVEAEASPQGCDATSVSEPIPDVVAPQPTEHDYRVRYELGMAYKYMGMVAEAVEEFRFAVQGKDCFLDATTMLAASLKDQGFVDPAIECLESALTDPRCDKEKAIPLRYELGVLYEATGAPDKASAIFSEIPTFLDVPIRLGRLQHAGKADASEEALQGEPTTAAAGHPASERKKRRISYL